MTDDYIAGMSARTKKLSLPNFFSGFDSTSDESVLPLNTAKRIYNFDYSSGALTEGWGIGQSGITSENVTYVWQFRRYDSVSGCEIKTLMYSCSDGSVYAAMPHGFSRLYGVNFSSAPQAVNYRLYGEDVILMFSQLDGMFVWNGIDPPYKVESAPDVTSFTMHYERMFVSTGGEKNTVWFSDDLDPTNWNLSLSDGGFIQLVDEFGSVNRVLSFAGYVYALRDRGISRITAYGSQKDFSVVNLFVSSGRIYGASAAVCGDTLMFLADDGLYRFDGLSARKVASAICGALKSSPSARGAYYDGKYFVAARFEETDGDSVDSESNNGFLVYDPKTGAVSLTRGIGLKELCPIDGALMAVDRNGRAGFIEKNGEIYGVPLEKSWMSGSLDFGTDGIKTVKEFSVDASVPFRLTVSSERGGKTFSVLPKKGLTTVRVNASGKKICFAITCKSSKARIARPFIKLGY